MALTFKWLFKTLTSCLFLSLHQIKSLISLQSPLLMTDCFGCFSLYSNGVFCSNQ